MCKTTTQQQPAPLTKIADLPANTTAGAVKPLQKYLEKYATQFVDELVPTTPPTLPSDVDPLAYKRVAFSILPLRATDVSPYYAGVFDEDTDFSASLVKVAALFAAGELLTKAKSALQSASSSPSFFTTFNAAIKTEITSNADNRVQTAHYPAGNIPIGLLPQMSKILQVTGFGTASGPSVSFTSSFNTAVKRMIVESDDPSAATCIDALGLGFISAVHNEKGFFDKTMTPGPDKPGATGRGIWLTADYGGQFIVRIPVINDHNDSQNATSHQICRLFSMIRLNQLPKSDTDTNTFMQNLLNEPKTGLNHTVPWISPSRSPGVAPQFAILQDKIGKAGLGFPQIPIVYSEGLIIQWNDTSQIDAFNEKIDPGKANPSIRLSGEIAICWQNLLGDILGNFDGIIEVLNNSISDFLDQTAL